MSSSAPSFLSVCLPIWDSDLILRVSLVVSVDKKDYRIILPSGDKKVTSPRLYEINVRELLDNPANSSLLQCLAGVSHNTINEDYLRSLVFNGGRRFYVLIGSPVTAIAGAILCVIEVDIGAASESVAAIFNSVSQLPLLQQLLGATILNHFAPQSQDGVTAFKVLINFFNGHELQYDHVGALVSPIRWWPKLHCIIFLAQDIATLQEGDISFWESVGLRLLYAGSDRARNSVLLMMRTLRNYSEDGHFHHSLDRLAEFGQGQFIRSLRSELYELPCELALRIIRCFQISVPRQYLTRRFWKVCTDTRIENFIFRNMSYEEEVSDLTTQLGEFYFRGELPLSRLSPQEAHVLLAMSLQGHDATGTAAILSVGHRKVYDCLRQALMETVDYFDEIKPRVPVEVIEQEFRERERRARG